MRAFISISTVFIVLFISCKNGNDIEPKNLIGQWRPTYEIFNDSTQQWEVIQTYMLLPNIEFTSDGKFLINNRPGSEGDCCGYIGSQYKVENNMVIFSNFGTPCLNALCLNSTCKGWSIKKLSEETLEIYQFELREIDERYFK